MSNKEIRRYLGHNGSECRVRIHRDGRITRHGSPDPADRSMDYWHDCGTLADAILSMRRRSGQVGWD